MSKNKTLYVYDFDGTISVNDTLFPLAKHYGKSGAYIAFPVYLLLAICHRFRLISNERLKKWFSVLFYRNRSGTDVDTVNAKLFSKIKTNKKVLIRLRRRVLDDKNVIILSANLEPNIQSWLNTEGLRDVAVIATKAESVDGVYTGRLVGKVCRGEEKVRRLDDYISGVLNSDRGDFRIISYADEQSDLPVMRYADRGIWIRGR